jgi:hypothetical protein
MYDGHAEYEKAQSLSVTPSFIDLEILNCLPHKMTFLI